MWPFVVIACIAVLLGLVLLAGLYLLVGPGPVRSRGYHRARRALEQGDWQDALATVESLQNDRLAPAWKDKLRILAGESRQAATDAALKEKEYEDALQHSLKAAALLGTPEADARAKVIDAMLAEVAPAVRGRARRHRRRPSTRRAASWPCNRPVRKRGSGRRCVSTAAARSIRPWRR